MKNIVALILFIAVPLIAGSLIGMSTAPDAWYAGLVKPSFNPPNWIFAPVWTLLYILIGIAGWLVWRIAPTSAAMLAWGIQMALNWLWSPVFFTLHSTGWALVIILVLLGTILAFMLAARRVDVRASWLFAPYALWVAFATILNAALWRLN